MTAGRASPDDVELVLHQLELLSLLRVCGSTAVGEVVPPLVQLLVEVVDQKLSLLGLRVPRRIESLVSEISEDRDRIFPEALGDGRRRGSRQLLALAGRSR